MCLRMYLKFYSSGSTYDFLGFYVFGGYGFYLQNLKCKIFLLKGNLPNIIILLLIQSNNIKTHSACSSQSPTENLSFTSPSTPSQSSRSPLPSRTEFADRFLCTIPPQLIPQYLTFSRNTSCIPLHQSHTDR